MSRVVLSVTVQKGNPLALADADVAPVWADQAGTYGIKRTDTGAIVVPLNVALTHVGTGLYQTEINPAVAGVTYQGYAKLQVNGETYWVSKSATAGADPASTSYLAGVEADLIAGTLPTISLPAWAAATAGDKTAALELASADVDAAGPWQGRKYNPSNGADGQPVQVRQFPRVAYETPSAGPYPTAGTRGIADVVWDWDAATQTAVVPLDVKRAVLYQADSILAGVRAQQLDNQHAGLASQSVGGLSESYRPVAGSIVDGLAVLCRPAATLMAKYRLKTGRLL